MPIQQMLLGVGAVAEKTYIDDIFSTFLYKGTGSTQSMNNGIDLSSEGGGMVWIKNREDAWGHALFDTERGVTKRLRVDENHAETTLSNSITSFNSNGFTIGSDGNINTSNEKHVSWTLRKAPGFFDIVKYTGTGSARTVDHNLGCVPGMIIIKRLDTADNWNVYHRSQHSSNSPGYYLQLNTTDSIGGASNRWNDTAPTATQFTVGTAPVVNASGDEFIAYIFAHDEQSFGTDENASVIKCGSYTGNGSSTGPTINLGWEPQLLIIKNANATTNWRIVDSMRGIVTGGDEAFLTPDLTEAEWDSNKIDLTSTGFKITASNGDVNESEDRIIYIAIRRPDGYVGKPPELGTDVFAMDTGGSSDTIPNFDSGFPVDWGWYRNPSTASSMWVPLRLTGPVEMKTSGNNAESSYASAVFDSNVGWSKSQSNNNTQSWMWKRHAGFDVVAFTGVSGTQAINHGLSKVPEMFVVKRRDNTGNWYCYHKGLNGGTNPEQWRVAWNSSAAADQSAASWSNTAPTATQFTTGTHSDTGNVAGATYIAMLFASVDGISKVGSFVGSDSDQTITLGFQPRFLIVKAYNQAYSWLQLDTTRGWATSSGNNSKYLFLELNWAQDNIDVGYLTSTGFVAKGGSGNINESGASYIYYAHA